MQKDKTIQKVTSLYKHYIEQQSDYNYVVNEDQFHSLCKSVDNMKKISDKLGGEMKHIELRPREIVGGITVIVPILDLFGETLQAFTEVLKTASAVGIDIQDGKICVSVTMPDIFNRISF
ncbi:MAG: hypothetical protein RR313_12710 [Anaerovoracaceae bacterium]